MRTEIEALQKENKKISLAQIAKEIGAEYTEVLKNAPNVREYPRERIEDLFETLRGWERVFLLLVTEGFVLEINDKFPKGFYGHGYLNFHDKDSSIGGHLSVGRIHSIYLVDDIMFGRRSCSIKFYSEDRKEIFSVYVPRNEKKELIPECLESFNNIV
ncbi:hypothetical protein PM10SUCC1_27800 [Propionigenium maris DSM 9537]|uniref:Heme utilization protein HuvX n=1 Tax=Propionigenium maris DSM 9537 TaxID=1123000 RepID=A0A9W6GNY5_9FUSO|nr:heme utilization cystosolic carrier protein HutX [Propionigenium maris]GLI57266.1 hypothetical protein PM10SUCC1_27800 [Propionigenium maris DSM 9537]